jgi:hypothetical protein
MRENMKARILIRAFMLYVRMQVFVPSDTPAKHPKILLTISLLSEKLLCWHFNGAVCT